MLKFTPYAWSKLRYLRDLGPTEVGGFGITAADDLLRVEDIQLVRQSCTAVHVEFDNESVADFFDEQVDAGRSPEQFARIWIHTHPGSSPAPSPTDEETFERCFGEAQWAVMFILAREGECYARIRSNVGPGAQQRIRCRTDFGAAFPGSDQDAWFAEYTNNVEDLDQHQSRSALWTDLDGLDRWNTRTGESSDWQDPFLEARR
ncbi:MAG: hypothetical protein ACO1RT_06230 [Planctomycetaceae bacterium]